MKELKANYFLIVQMFLRLTSTDSCPNSFDSNIYPEINMKNESIKLLTRQRALRPLDFWVNSYIYLFDQQSSALRKHPQGPQPL